jgi:hypothetical protein
LKIITRLSGVHQRHHAEIGNIFLIFINISSVQTNLPITVPVEVECVCKHEFCFKCIQAPHLPATCNMAKAWTKKCKDDSETSNW